MSSSADVLRSERRGKVRSMQRYVMAFFFTIAATEGGWPAHEILKQTDRVYVLRRHSVKSWVKKRKVGYVCTYNNRREEISWCSLWKQMSPPFNTHTRLLFFCHIISSKGGDTLTKKNKER